MATALFAAKGSIMSTSFPGSENSPYGPGRQPPYTAPPTSTSGSGSAVVMIVVALGVVILLVLACAGAAVGFLLFARASQDMEVMEAENRAMRMDEMAARRAEFEAQAKLESSPPSDATVSREGFTPPDPRRARWSYPTSAEGANGSIAQQDAGTWVETRSDNLTMRFAEVARTDEYVDLYDAQRLLTVRLYADHMEWKKDGQDWFRGQEGSWEAAPSMSSPSSAKG